MSEWAKRALLFTESLKDVAPDAVISANIAPPLTQQQLEAIEIQLPHRIPKSIADFLLSESASCECEYMFTVQGEPTEYAVMHFGEEMALRFAETAVYGGASLCQSHRFVEWHDDSVSGSLEGIDSELDFLWKNVFFFKFMTSGDFLALDLRDERADPPVVYLGPTTEMPRPIANSFSSFLDVWEKLNYIGPDFAMIEEFINPQSGYLDPRCGDVEGLLALFQ